MGAVHFQTKLMAGVLITFLLVALQAPVILRSYGPGKALAIAFDSRSAGSRKINAGRESPFQRAGLDSDKGENLVGIGISLRDRARSLASKRRVQSPPPAPMRNRQKITVKTSTPHRIHRRH